MKKPKQSEPDDWREKIRNSMGTRVNRLMLIEAGDDDKAALDAIKVLIELGGEVTKEAEADTSPLFALPTNTQPQVLPVKPRKDIH